MADQKRWFKVWTSILDDPHFQELDLEDIGRWAVLGAMTSLVGTKGTLDVPPTARRLCQVLGVKTPQEAKRALARLPNLYLSDHPVRWPHGHDKPPVSDGPVWRGGVLVTCGVATPVTPGFVLFEEWCTHNGAFVVTFKNWQKYQEDTTAAARGRALRSKRRGEERRGDESNPPSVLRTGVPLQNGNGHWPERLQDVHTWLIQHEAPEELIDPAYWQRIDDWLGAEDSGVGYLDELAKFLAWRTALPKPQQPRQLKRAFRNWLAKSEFWSQQRAQTEARRPKPFRR